MTETIDENVESSPCEPCELEDSACDFEEASPLNSEVSSCKTEVLSCNVLYSKEEFGKDKVSSCHLDQEMMIELIKHHPIIWNTKSKEYNMTAKRVHAWKYVSSQLGIDENICRSKWKNIRDSYKKCINRREIAMRSGARRKKPPFCRYFKELEFLHDVVSIKEPTDNITSTSQSSGNEESKCAQAKTFIVCTDSGEEYLSQTLPVNFESLQEDKMKTLHEEKLKRTSSSSEAEQQQEHAYSLIRDYTKTEKSETEFFCASLVGTLDRLDQRKRQLAKIRIQQVLFEIEFNDQESLSS